MGKEDIEARIRRIRQEREREENQKLEQQQDEQSAQLLAKTTLDLMAQQDPQKIENARIIQELMDDPRIEEIYKAVCARSEGGSRTMQKKYPTISAHQDGSRGSIVFCFNSGQFIHGSQDELYFDVEDGKIHIWLRSRGYAATFQSIDDFFVKVEVALAELDLRNKGKFFFNKEKIGHSGLARLVGNLIEI